MSACSWMRRNCYSVKRTVKVRSFFCFIGFFPFCKVGAGARVPGGDRPEPTEPAGETCPPFVLTDNVGQALCLPSLKGRSVWV